MAEIPDGRSLILIAMQSAVKFTRELQTPRLVIYVADVSPIEASARLLLKRKCADFQTYYLPGRFSK